MVFGEVSRNIVCCVSLRYNIVNMKLYVLLCLLIGNGTMVCIINIDVNFKPSILALRNTAILLENALKTNEFNRNIHLNYKDNLKAQMKSDKVSTGVILSSVYKYMKFLNSSARVCGMLSTHTIL